MKKLLLILCSLISFSLCHKAFANDYPTIKRLQNGLTILLIEDHRFPIVSTRLYVRTGSTNEKQDKLGIAHLLEHMVFKGTKTHPHGIEALVENEGGTLNAYTSYDQTVYYNDMPAQKWKLSLEAIQGLAFDPILRPKQLEEERKIVIAELRQRGDQPQTKLLHLSTQSTLHGTPYANPVIGYVETLNSITTQDIKDYIKANYNPNNMLLVVAGDINEELVFKEIQKRFSHYTNISTINDKKPLSLAEIQNLAQGITINIEKGNWNKSYVNISFAGPHETSADSHALLMLTMLLSFDDNALLTQEFKQKEKLVDTISAYPMFFAKAGQFNIYAELDSRNIQEFITKLSQTLNKLTAESFSDKEYEQVRTMLENLYWKKAETIQSLADTYGDNFFNNPTDPLGENVLYAIHSTNKKSIQEVINKYIRPSALNISFLIPNDITLNKEELTATIQKNWQQKEQKQNENTKNQNSVIEVIELDNKTIVLLKDNHIPFVNVGISYLGGESLLPFVDAKNKEALPALTAELLTKGTSKKNYQKLTAFLSEKDLYLSANAQSLSFQLSAGGHKRFTQDIFNILTETIIKPKFSDNELDLVKHEQIAKIKNTNDSVIASTMTKLPSFLFPHHILGNNKIGTEKSVNAITTKDIKNFWEKQKEQKIVISVSGDFDKEEVLSLIKELPNPEPITIKIDQPQWNKQKDFNIIIEGRNQDLTLLLFPTVNENHPDAPTLQVLNAAMEGFNGILYQELREKRNLGYSAFPLISQNEYVGFIGYGIIAAPEHQKTIQEQFIAITKTLHTKGISQKEFNRAKASLLMNFIDMQQKPSTKASTSANAVLFGKSPNYAQEQLDKIMNVRLEDVNACIKKYLLLDMSYHIHSGAN